MEECLPDFEGVAESTAAGSASDRPHTIWTSVAGDVHFWVPTVVLIAGLVLLRWAS